VPRAATSDAGLGVKCAAEERSSDLERSNEQ